MSEAEFVYDARRRPSRRRFIVLPAGGEAVNEAVAVAGVGAPKAVSASATRKNRERAVTLMLVLDLPDLLDMRISQLDQECPKLATSTGLSF